MFANMYLAYESLSDGMKAMLDGLTAIYSSEKGYAGKRAERMKSLQGMKDAVASTVETFESEHPVVRTHPVTGRKSLYISKSHTLRFKDMTVAGKRAANQLLERLRRASRIHLPAAVAAADPGRVGQPLHEPLRRQRLQRKGEADAPRDARGRPAAVTLVLGQGYQVICSRPANIRLRPVVEGDCA